MGLVRAAFSSLISLLAVLVSLVAVLVGLVVVLVGLVIIFRIEFKISGFFIFTV